MKSKRMNYIAISVFIVLLCGSFGSIVGYMTNKVETQGLSFKAKANKKVYVLGEPVKVEFEFFNEEKNSVLIPAGGVEVGNLKVFIANQDGEYKEYFASGWGACEAIESLLEQNNRTNTEL